MIFIIGNSMIDSVTLLADIAHYRKKYTELKECCPIQKGTSTTFADD